MNITIPHNGEEPRTLAVVSIILRDTPHGHFAIYYSQMPHENELTAAKLREINALSPAVLAATAVMTYLEGHARQVIKKGKPQIELIVP